MLILVESKETPESSSSNHETVNIQCSLFPFAIIKNMCTSYSITNLIDDNQLPFLQALSYCKYTTFKSFKKEVQVKYSGYSIDNNGKQVILTDENFWFVCKPIFMKFMVEMFLNDLIKELDVKIEDDQDDYLLPIESFSKIALLSKFNRLDLLELIYQKTPLFNENPDSLIIASKYGHLEIVQYLGGLNLACSSRAMDFAAYENHLDIVEWLHLNRSEGCSTDAIRYSARMGNLKVVEYLVEKKLECDLDILRNVMKEANESGYYQVAEYLLGKIKS